MRTQAYLINNRLAPEVYEAFLAAVTRRQMTQRQGLEEALREWAQRVLAESGGEA